MSFSSISASRHSDILRNKLLARSATRPLSLIADIFHHFCGAWWDVRNVDAGRMLGTFFLLFQEEGPFEFFERDERS